MRKHITIEAFVDTDLDDNFIREGVGETLEDLAQYNGVSHEGFTIKITPSEVQSRDGEAVSGYYPPIASDGSDVTVPDNSGGHSPQLKRSLTSRLLGR